MTCLPALNGPIARRAVLLAVPLAAALWWFLFAHQVAWADVGPAGSFTTSVPIQVPSYHGLQPGLALRYSSQAGDGWLGEGWALDGTSVIERQSGVHGLPAWDGSDHYALDGTDLVACAGGSPRVTASPSCAHQVAGTAGYASQVASDQRITFTSSAQGGTWTVWRTDGTTVTYEPATVTSKGVLDWRVSTVRDTSGNTVSYHWTDTAGNEPELSSIRYGDVVLTFKTISRQDPMTVADGAGLLAENDLLSEVDETAAGQPVRSYRLSYTLNAGTTRESFLQSVRQYGSDGTTAYPATTYNTSSTSVNTWQAKSSTVVQALVTNWPAGPADGSRWDQSLGGSAQGALSWPNVGDGTTWLTADINNDQRMDIVQVRPNGSQGLVVEAERNSDSGGYTAVKSLLTFNWPVSLTGAKVLLGDVNGDGYPDLVVSANGYVGVALNQTPAGADSVFAVAAPAPTKISGSVTVVADVTGDGKADVVETDPPSPGCGGAASLQTLFSDGKGGFQTGPGSCLPSETIGLGLPNPFEAVDLNNDLKADLATYIDAHSTTKTGDPGDLLPSTSLIVTAVSTGDGRFAVQYQDTGQDWPAYTTAVYSDRCPQDPATGPPYNDRCAISANEPAIWGDFDGDHRTDLAVLTAGTGGTEVVHVFPSLGDGTFGMLQSWSTPLPATALNRYDNVPAGGVAVGVQSGELAAVPDQVLAGDFDGDGQTDLAVLATTADGTTYSSLSRLLNDEHDGFLQESPRPVNWGVADCLAAPPPTCVRPLVTTGDINGDGRDDITVIGGQATGAASTETDVTRAGPRLSGILAGDVNGDGLTDEVSIAMASDSTVEVRTYLGAEDGLLTRLAPVTVSVADVGLKHLPADGWRLADVTGDHQADLVNLPAGARYGVILVATGAHGWTEHTISLTGLDRVIQGPPKGGTVSCTPKPIHCITIGGTPTTIDEPALLPRIGEWQIADITGDGIPDLVHAGPGPWGTAGVLVLAGSPSGVLTTEWTPAPDATFAAALRDTIGWHLADVNGDGSADLVDADTASGQVVTLLRHGNGWVPVEQGFTTTSTTTGLCLHPTGSCRPGANVLVEATGADDGAWQPVDVNGDGSQDLARVLAEPPDKTGDPRQLVVETLISLGDGDWQPGPATTLSDTATSGTTQPSYLSEADNENWTATDLDLDGRSDLVKATEWDGALRIQMLLSNGPGGWTLSQTIAPGTVNPGGAENWAVQADHGTVTLTHLTDSTGDYRLDLVRSGYTPEVITSTHNGLGASTQVTYSAASAFTAADTPAGQCRLPQDRAPFVVTGLTTSVLDPGLTPAAPTAGHTTAQPAIYLVQSGDTLGRISQAKLGDASRWPQIWAVNEDRAEPGGASFTNAADLEPGWSLLLPAQTPADDALTVTAGQTVSDSSTFRYSCGQFSVPLRSFLGWTDTWTVHDAAADPVTGSGGRPASIEHVTRSIDAASGLDQVTLDEVTDAAGTPLKRTTTSFEPAGDSPPYVNLTARTDTGDCAAGTCADSSAVFTYDADGNVTSETDTAAGSGLQRETTTSYLYDEAAWLHDQPRVTETYADNNGAKQMLRATLTCYDDDASGECPAQQPPANRGLLTATREFNGSTWLAMDTYTYDSFGNQLTDTDADGHTTTTTYDPAGLFPVKTCNALSQCSTSAGWDRAAEAPTQTTAITGGQTTTQYDPLGRPIRSTGPTGIVITTSYALSGSGTLTTTTETAGALSHWTNTLTDGLGRVVRTESPASGGTVAETDTLYLDASLTAVQTAQHAAGRPVTDWTATNYDALGRPVASEHADGSTAATSYGLSDGYSTTRTADEDGNDITTRYSDGWGNLAQVTQDSVEHPGQQSTVSYIDDVLGQQTATTDPHGNTENVTWNMLGQKTADNDPDRGLTSYRYDPAGNLTWTQDARGRIVTTQYDALNRPVASTDSTTGQRKTWIYDGAGGADTGQLTAESDPSASGCAGQVSHRWNYNLLGAVTQQTQCTGGLIATITTSYDALGERTAVTYPDKLTVKQTYDAAGQLTAVPGYVSAITYTGAGQVASVSYANGTSASDSYDLARGWLTAQDVTSSASHGNVFDQAYTYDPAGTIVATSSDSSGQDLAYTYNTLDELTGVTNAATGQSTQTLQYDDLGNIVSNSTVGAYRYPASRQCSGSDCTGPQAAQAAGGHTYTYDTDGDTLTDTVGGVTTTYSWTTDGMLATVSAPGAGTVTSTYDADDNLVKQADRAGTTVYVGDLALHTSAGWTDYIYANGTLVAQHGGSKTLWYTEDEQGSTRAVTDESGQLVSASSYTAYGAPQSGAAQQRGYTGAQPVGSSSLLDLQARDYAPATGRMLSADTITPTDTAIGLNRYAYANDNPIQYSDPTGHDSTEGAWSRVDWAQFVAVSAVYATEGSAAFNSPATAESAVEELAASTPVDTPDSPPSAASACRSCHLLDADEPADTPGMGDVKLAEGDVPIAQGGYLRPETYGDLTAMSNSDMLTTIVANGIPAESVNGYAPPTADQRELALEMEEISVVLQVLFQTTSFGLQPVPTTVGWGSGGSFYDAAPSVMNPANGTAWQLDAADAFMQAGFRVEVNPGEVMTPYARIGGTGIRKPDLAIYDQQGNLLELIECKASPTARYTLLNREQDQWIYDNWGVITSVVRQAVGGGVR